MVNKLVILEKIVVCNLIFWRNGTYVNMSGRDKKRIIYKG